LVTIPNFKVVVVTVSFVGRRLNTKSIPKINPNKVSKVSSESPKAGDIFRIFLWVHGTVKLQRGRVPMGEIPTIFLKQRRIDASLKLSICGLGLA